VVVVVVVVVVVMIWWWWWSWSWLMVVVVVVTSAVMYRLLTLKQDVNSIHLALSIACLGATAGSKTFTKGCLEAQESRATLPTCSKVCNRKLNCGKHRCTETCCP
jgi:hypothetical protein